MKLTNEELLYLINIIKYSYNDKASEEEKQSVINLRNKFIELYRKTEYNICKNKNTLGKLDKKNETR